MQDENAALRSGYAAFISYSHRDEKIAAWLQNAIERYVVPQRLVGRATRTGVIPRRLGKCFRDRDELPAGSDLGREIVGAIEQSSFMVVVCSPAAAESAWVNQEVLSFKRSHGADRVIAVIAAGEPFAKSDAGLAECLPSALRFQLDASGALTADPAEPIAADLRPGKDPKRIVLLKVLAGMLGLGLDELVQRESQRRQRVYGWIASGSVLASMAFAGLAVVAVQQRNIAVKATAIAAERRTQAEGLIEFMITDLHDKLQTVGRLDVLDSATERSLAYFASLSPDDMDSTAIGQKTRVLTSLGNQQNQRGQQSQALESYMLAFQSAESALQKAPNDPARIYEYALSLHSLGYYYYMRADFEKSKKYFMDALKYYDNSDVKISDKRLFDYGKAEKNLGVIFFNEMTLLESISYFEKSKKIFSDLSIKSPENQGYLFEYADSLAWMSDVARLLGKLNDAMTLRENQIGLIQKSLNQSPGNKELSIALITARRKVAALKIDMGKYIESYNELIDIEKENQNLYDFDPNNVGLLVRLAATSLELLQSAVYAGYINEAGPILERAKEHSEKLSASIDKSAKAALEIEAQLHMAKAAFWNAKGEYGKTIALAEPDIAHLGEAPGEDHGPRLSLSLITNRVVLAYLAAQAYDAQAEPAKSLDLKRRIEREIARLPEPHSIVFDAVRAQILGPLDRPDEARKSLHVACRSGYHPIINSADCINISFQ